MFTNHEKYSIIYVCTYIRRKHGHHGSAVPRTEKIRLSTHKAVPDEAPPGERQGHPGMARQAAVKAGRNQGADKEGNRKGGKMKMCPPAHFQKIRMTNPRHEEYTTPEAKNPDAVVQNSLCLPFHKNTEKNGCSGAELFSSCPAGTETLFLPLLCRP